MVLTRAEHPEEYQGKDGALSVSPGPNEKAHGVYEATGLISLQDLINNLSLIISSSEFFVLIDSRENAGRAVFNPIPKTLTASLVPSDLRARFGRRKFALSVAF